MQFSFSPPTQSSQCSGHRSNSLLVFTWSSATRTQELRALETWASSSPFIREASSTFGWAAPALTAPSAWGQMKPTPVQSSTPIMADPAHCTSHAGTWPWTHSGPPHWTSVKDSETRAQPRQSTRPRTPSQLRSPSLEGEQRISGAREWSVQRFCKKPKARPDAG